MEELSLGMTDKNNIGDNFGIKIYRPNYKKLVHIQIEEVNSDG